MVKRLKLATRGLGAEPGVPDVIALAAWIAANRGTSADIITYQLDKSLEPQVSAGIMAPCAGGRFYKERIVKCLFGVENGQTTGEISLDPHAIHEDAAGIVVQKKVHGAPCQPPMSSGSWIRIMMMNMSGTMRSPAHTGS